jgi:hypothetical protein
MNQTQRQAAFDRFLVAQARAAAARLKARYLGTITKLPPPPLPGEVSGKTRYYSNTLSQRGAALVEITGSAGEALARGERWVASGEGSIPGSGPRSRAKGR